MKQQPDSSKLTAKDRDSKVRQRPPVDTATELRFPVFSVPAIASPITLEDVRQALDEE